MLIALSLLLVAYLLGSLSGSLLLGRLRGVDIRTQGSGNAGGTNQALLDESSTVGLGHGGSLGGRRIGAEYSAPGRLLPREAKHAPRRGEDERIP